MWTPWIDSCTLLIDLFFARRQNDVTVGCFSVVHVSPCRVQHSIVALGTASKYLSNPFSRLWINNRCPLELFYASINNRLRCSLLLLLELSLRLANCILYLRSVYVDWKYLNYLFFFTELWNTALSVEENIVKMCYLSKIVKIIKTNYFVLMVSLQKYYLNLSLMNKIHE